MRTVRGPLALVLALALLPRVARADDATASDGVERRVTALEERLAKLQEERQREREDEARREAARAPAARISGMAHIDWVAHRGSSEDEVSADGAPLNEDRFVLRRARLRAETDRGLVHAQLALDANTVSGPQVRPWNAEASLKWPAERPYPGAELARERRPDGPFVMVTAGLFFTPFGYEVPELERRRPWLERTTTSNALFPQSADLGVRVVGSYKIANWTLGIMNGDPIGERTFPGRDPNKSKELVLRVGAAGSVSDGVRIAGGVSALTGRGFHAGERATKDQLVWRDQNEDGVVQTPELQVTPGAPASPSESFQRFAVGADARVEVDLPVLGVLALRAEIVRAKNLDRGLVVADPVAASRDLRELGWYVGATQEITRWSMIAVRYDLYDPDADASEQRPFAVVPRDARFRTWSFMAAARWPKVGRLVGQYDRRQNALGRDASGSPTTLADDAFTLRAEVLF